MHWPLCATVLLVMSAACAQPPSATSVLQEAEQASLRAHDAETRALCLASLSASWRPVDPAQTSRLAAQAAEVGAAIADPLSRALTLRGIALRLAAAEPAAARAALEQGLAVARGLKYPVEQAVALRELCGASHSAAADLYAGLQTEAADAARKTPDAVTRGACLRDLAALVAPTDAVAAGALFAEALRALSGPGTQDVEAVLARGELAAAWATLDLAAARAAVDASAEPAQRASTLAAMARQVAARRPEAALSLAAELPEGPARAQVIAAAAVALPAEQALSAGSLAEVALGMAGTSGQAAQMAIADAAVALARTDAARAEKLARGLTDTEQQDTTLAAVAERIAETDLARGLQLLATIGDPLAREPVASRLAPRLVATAPEDALALARGIYGRRLKVEALLGVAAALVGAR